MLVSVVDNGFDKARIEGYDVAGKTGTAQIADAQGGYTEDTYIHNFIGFAPASNPRFVIFIKIDRPQGGRFASTTLTESFKEMAKFLLNHFNIPPTR
jgi:cell division protein FtsI/penicillin-binding protein 2